MEIKISSFGVVSSGYYFEVEKNSEIFGVENHCRTYPFNEVIIVPRYSNLNFYISNGISKTLSKTYKNELDHDIMVMGVKKNYKDSITPSDGIIYIYSEKEQITKEEFKNKIRKLENN